MDIRIRRMRECIEEYDGAKEYLFYFQNLDNDDIAVISWMVSERTGKQLLSLRIEYGESEQLIDLLKTYISAKPFAESFDLETVKFLFEQYAENENIEIICE